MGIQVGEDTRQGNRQGCMRWWLVDQAVPHSCADNQITGKNNWGARQTAQPRVLAWGNRASKPLAVKIYQSCGGRETPGLTAEFLGEICRVLETHPPRN